MSEIVFTARLTEDDWDEAMRGWRCQVLLVPGAIVEAIYVEGDRIDSARYEVEAGRVTRAVGINFDDVVPWRHGSCPFDGVAVCVLVPPCK
jgi:hypothetical protein